MRHFTTHARTEKCSFRVTVPFDPGPKASEIMDKADFIVEFKHQGKEMTGTPASLMKKRRFCRSP